MGRKGAMGGGGNKAARQWFYKEDGKRNFLLPWHSFSLLWALFETTIFSIVSYRTSSAPLSSNFEFTYSAPAGGSSVDGPIGLDPGLKEQQDWRRPLPRINVMLPLPWRISLALIS